MVKKEFHIGYDVVTNHWDYIEAFTEAEAEAILITQVSDDKHVPQDQVLIHCIDET